MISAAHHTAMRGGKAAYLQADGIVWIDTGVPVSTDYEIRAKVQIVSGFASQDLAVFAFWSNPAGVQYSNEAALRFGYRRGLASLAFQCGATTWTAVSGGVSDVHEVHAFNGGLTIDGVTYSSQARTLSDSSMTQHLFGLSYRMGGNRQHATQDVNSIIRIWSASWEDANGNLVRDFVPKVVGGQAGMFDRVTQTFFGPASASTGVFSIGTGA